MGVIGRVHHVTVNWHVETYSPGRDAVVEARGGSGGLSTASVRTCSIIWNGSSDPISRIQCALTVGQVRQRGAALDRVQAGGVGAVSIASNSFSAADTVSRSMA